MSGAAMLWLVVRMILMFVLGASAATTRTNALQLTVTLAAATLVILLAVLNYQNERTRL